MSIPVVICDDSKLARKQMMRALPADWNVDVTFAANGREAIEAIRAGRGDVLFLDLNMPEMDGYDVLATIRKEDLPTMTIVVSGDVQPEARQRVMRLGALDFIRKPVDSAQILEILDKYGIREEEPPAATEEVQQVDLWDCYREVTNVAMGRAADLLARLLNIFVIMPLPRVSMISRGELHKTLQQVAQGERVSAVCQGFIGSGIAGEALLIFNESSIRDIAALLKHEGGLDERQEVELLMDISSILIGACLQGFSEQLDIGFSQGAPKMLGQQVQVADLLQRNPLQWENILAIEIGYRIENCNINCDLLLLFTEDSMPAFNEHVSYVMG
ncbi:MAG TPA: response regulator [Gammaproteobacteria bacterium]|nr:response regulator [Gammaproteobacteria bacterium]